ncbi:hypothetical protein GOBAR_DD27934 [Gossypium barbadense]|nr:hypothetical protein GOBAR_DD27934 [Gossypium barbadense]
MKFSFYLQGIYNSSVNQGSMLVWEATIQCPAPLTSSSVPFVELKTRIKKYFEGDEEAILRRKLAGKHEETDDELMDELEVQPRDDVDDEVFESDFDNLYSTNEEILAILAMFLMK